MVTGRTTNSGPGRLRQTLAALAALAAVAVLPQTAGVAAAADLPGYRPAADATKTTGAARTSQAPQIKPGMYTDSIKRGEEKYYAVALDAKSSAYFSAVAAPKPGSKVADYGDGLSIAVKDGNNSVCGSQARQSFRGDGTAYPIADYATRTIGPDISSCQEAGLYYVVVSREGSATSDPTPWPIELGYLKEPAVKGAAPQQPREGSWSTVTPPPPTDAVKHAARGGTGFNDAGSVGDGVWTDRIKPGESRFYRVPADWGQRLNLSAELPNATAGSQDFVSGALGLNVYNPARGMVEGGRFVSYAGDPAEVKQFTAPVAYGNRFDSSDAISVMRFAGWYYLEVTLHPDTAAYFPKGADLTLRVDVRGTATAGPAYAGPAGDFSVTPEDRDMAAKGQTEQEAEKSGTLQLVGYAGIGAGVVLLLALAVWTVVARRRVARAPVPAAPGIGRGSGHFPQQGPPAPQDQRSQQFGPPQGW